MNGNLSYDRLLAYAAGALPQAELDAVAAALATDAEAAATIAKLRLVAQTVRADVTVPAESLVAARQIFREAQVRKAAAQPTLAERGLALLQRVLAQLTFDSRPNVALAGLRGGSDRYQIAYEASGFEVELEIERGQGEAARTVLGQISTGAATATAVLLVPAGGDTIVSQATPDESGVFRLTAGPGAFDLLVQVGTQLTVLPGVEID